MKKFLVLWMLVYPSLAYGQSEPDYKNIAKACELWGLIKYFNPNKPSAEFDSAFAAQAEKMLSAKDDNDWKTILNNWLQVLNDPANHIVSPKQLPIGNFTSEWTADSLLVVKIFGSKFMDDYWETAGSVSGILDQSKHANGIVFDLRQDVEMPVREAETMHYQFDAFGINKHFGTEYIPKYRTVVYSGYEPEDGLRSGGYATKENLQNGIRAESPFGFKVKTVWIVNRFSTLPAVALSQQAAGTGFIISDTERLDHLLPVTHEFQWSDSMKIKFRTADLVMPVSGRVKADLVYSFSQNVLEAAKDLILHGSKQKNGILNNTVSISRKRPYPAEKFPALGYRILAAAKIYTVIENFFPYHQYMDKDWKQVIKESLPDFIFAKNEEEYGLAVAKMYSNIQDSHGYFSGNTAIDKLFGQAFSPIMVEWIEDKAVITRFRNDSICKANGLKIGDIVSKVNGVPIEKLMEKYFIYFPHSTPQEITQRAVTLTLRGPKGEKSIFTIQDGDKKNTDHVLDFSSDYSKKFVKKYKLDTLELLNESIGYADLTRMESSQTDRLFEKFRNTKVIIFDMRGYGLGASWEIASFLTEKKHIPFALYKKPQVIAPNILMGQFLSTRSYTESLQALESSGQRKYKGMTIMLINQHPVSQFEHECLLFEAANNTVFIGSPTAGVDGDITNFEIPGGISLTFSGQGVWHADGRQLQRLGIQPHVLVKPTIKGIREGKDEILEKAIEWVNQNVK